MGTFASRDTESTYIVLSRFKRSQLSSVCGMCCTY